MPICTRCHDTGYVCENHPGLPWGAMCCHDGSFGAGLCQHGACGCGAGEPCRDCSPLAPRMRADRNRWYWSGPDAAERRMLRLVGRLREPRHWGSDGPSVLRTMRHRRNWKR